MHSLVKTDKQRIAQTFGKAAVHYDNHANIQRYSGNKLMDLARYDSGKIVLDAGCGTGYFSQKWKQQGKFVIALDLSHTMLQVAKQQQRADGYLQSDIEHCAITPQSVDIVFSNLAMQWCDDLSVAINSLMKAVNKKGALYFSTLTTLTLQEVREAWLSLDQHPHVNPFYRFTILRKRVVAFIANFLLKRLQNIMIHYMRCLLL